MQDLADGGGIYTLGRQPGAIIKGNYIHDIPRSKDAVGSRNNGILFDQASSEMTVEDNVIKGVANEDLRFNMTQATKMTFKKNSLAKEKVDNDLNTSIPKMVGPGKAVVNQ